MTTTRKRYSAKFKARVAVEAIRGEKSLSQLAAQFQVHPVQIAQWKKAALATARVVCGWSYSKDWGR